MEALNLIISWSLFLTIFPNPVCLEMTKSNNGRGKIGHKPWNFWLAMSWTKQLPYHRAEEIGKSKMDTGKRVGDLF